MYTNIDFRFPDKYDQKTAKQERFRLKKMQYQLKVKAGVIAGGGIALLIMMLHFSGEFTTHPMIRALTFMAALLILVLMLVKEHDKRETLADEIKSLETVNLDQGLGVYLDDVVEAIENSNAAARYYLKVDEQSRGFLRGEIRQVKALAYEDEKNKRIKERRIKLQEKVHYAKMRARELAGT